MTCRSRHPPRTAAAPPGGHGHSGGPQGGSGAGGGAFAAWGSSIAHYLDALYFTVTALTTTGFGDITLPGTTGRLI